MDGRTLLAADLHLDPARPGTVAAARRFVDSAHGCDALWLLGDLFEAWIGDDAFDAVAGDDLRRFADALAALASGGTAVHLMHGNRDFLIGEDFAARVGATLHREDEVIATLGGERTLLLHGDTLCTDDIEYQRARPTLRSTAWQAEQLAKSVPERLDIAAGMRGRSGRNDIVDVAPAEVDARFDATGASLMIHGHVHRPAEHPGPMGPDGSNGPGIPGNPGRRRLVVGDWDETGAVVAVADAAGSSLARFSARLPA